MPEYFPEWKEQTATQQPAQNNSGSSGSEGQATSGGPRGLEEAVFLGAQVASKVVFVIDQGISKGFMSRVEYNEGGPSAIHEYVM